MQPIEHVLHGPPRPLPDAFTTDTDTFCALARERGRWLDSRTAVAEQTRRVSFPPRRTPRLLGPPRADLVPPRVIPAPRRFPHPVAAYWRDVGIMARALAAPKPRPIAPDDVRGDDSWTVANIAFAACGDVGNLEDEQSTNLRMARSRSMPRRNHNASTRGGPVKSTAPFPRWAAPGQYPAALRIAAGAPTAPLAADGFLVPPGVPVWLTRKGTVAKRQPRTDMTTGAPDVMPRESGGRGRKAQRPRGVPAEATRRQVRRDGKRVRRWIHDGREWDDNGTLVVGQARPTDTADDSPTPRVTM